MSLPPHIFIEYVIYNPADGIIDGTSLYEILIVGGAVGNIKVVTTASVPFGINSVECKRDNCVNICSEGRFRPGGIDLAARHIFYIFRKRYLNVRRIRTGRPQMYCNRVRDYDLAQDARFHIGSFLFSGVPHGDCRFPHRDFQCDILPLRTLHGGEGHGQYGCLPVIDGDIRDKQGIETGVLRKNRVGSKR